MATSRAPRRGAVSARHRDTETSRTSSPGLGRPRSSCATSVSVVARWSAPAPLACMCSRLSGRGARGRFRPLLGGVPWCWCSACASATSSARLRRRGGRCCRYGGQPHRPRRHRPFEGVPSPFVAVRYLLVRTVPSCLRVTARCGEARDGGESRVAAATRRPVPPRSTETSTPPPAASFLRLAGVAAVATAAAALAPPPPPATAAESPSVQRCSTAITPRNTLGRCRRRSASSSACLQRRRELLARRRRRRRASAAAPRFSYMGCDGGPHASLRRRDAIDGADLGAAAREPRRMGRARAVAASSDGGGAARQARLRRAVSVTSGTRLGAGWGRGGGAEPQPGSEELGSGAAEERCCCRPSPRLTTAHARLYLLCLCRDDGGERARAAARSAAVARGCAPCGSSPRRAAAAGSWRAAAAAACACERPVAAEYLGDIARSKRAPRRRDLRSISGRRRCDARRTRRCRAALRNLRGSTRRPTPRTFADPLRLLATDEFGPGGAAVLVVARARPERWCRRRRRCRPSKAPPFATPTRRTRRRRRRGRRRAARTCHRSRSATTSPASARPARRVLTPRRRILPRSTSSSRR